MIVPHDIQIVDQNVVNVESIQREGRATAGYFVIYSYWSIMGDVVRSGYVQGYLSDKRVFSHTNTATTYDCGLERQGESDSYDVSGCSVRFRSERYSPMSANGYFDTGCRYNSIIDECTLLHCYRESSIVHARAGVYNYPRYLGP